MNWLRRLLPGDSSAASSGREPAVRAHEIPIPTLWLFGKTGSGKTSLIRYLTGATDAEIGRGYRPCTQYSRLYSFPDEELPLLRFLDTRGLGEASYDPTEDLAAADADSQLVIVVVRLTDHADDAVREPFQQVRRSNPRRPVLLVLTCLHDAYPGQQHPQPNPFGSTKDARDVSSSDSVPENVRRCLQLQAERWGAWVDRVVAVDLTPTEDGFEDPHFGGPDLKRAIIDLLPSSYRQTLIQMDKLSGHFSAAHQREASRIIVSRSIIAATAAAVPVPWIDIPFVLGVQANLAHRLAAMNHHKLDAKTLANVTAAIGGRVALRMGLRELLKIVPWVGVVANAAAAFAMTYASGWAWNWYFMQISHGHVPTTDELRRVYHDQLQRAAELWQTTHSESDDV